MYILIPSTQLRFPKQKKEKGKGKKVARTHKFSSTLEHSRNAKQGQKGTGKGGNVVDI